MTTQPRSARRRRRGAQAAVLGLSALFLIACAAGPNDVSNAHAQAAGFWLGLWQGLISPITFVISLFTSNVSVYEVHNSGNWYDFGFILGVAISFSGPARLGGRGGSRRARRDRLPAA